MFFVEWCVKSNQFVGRCRVHPLFVFYADNAEDAIRGIQMLADGLDLDNGVTDVDIQYEDTDVAPEKTNTYWPPFIDTQIFRK